MRYRRLDDYELDPQLFEETPGQELALPPGWEPIDRFLAGFWGRMNTRPPTETLKWTVQWFECKGLKPHNPEGNELRIPEGWEPFARTRDGFWCKRILEPAE